MAEIESIKIKTKEGKEINLSIEEAENLHFELGKLFNKKTEIVQNPICPNPWYPITSYSITPQWEAMVCE